MSPSGWINRAAAPSVCLMPATHIISKVDRSKVEGSVVLSLQGKSAAAASLMTSQQSTVTASFNTQPSAVSMHVIHTVLLSVHHGMR